MTAAHLRSRRAALRLVRLLALASLLVPARLSAQALLRGTVVDPAGAPVQDAVVQGTASEWSGEARTDAAGNFRLVVPRAASVAIVVRATAFAEVRLLVASGEMVGPICVTLPLPPLAERVTVTAARTDEVVANTPVSVVILPSAALDASPSLALDDTLRQVPGFTLFRRTGSLTANPTAQGVSLRGVGASGASRALVLDDGVPLNDPFGGWVYWDRVPTALLDRVEVVRGGASDLYGSGAISGVVNLVRRPVRTPFTRATAWAGSMGTARVDGAAGATPGRWEIVGAGEWLRTDGYVPVAEAERGAVDSPVASRHASAHVSVARRVGAAGRAFARTSLFGESRHNGTPLQVNDTQSGQLVAGGDAGLFSGLLSVRGYAGRQSFKQTFSTISADRRSERPVRRQNVPSNDEGASVQWARGVSRHRLIAGVEGRRVEGTNHEDAWTAASGWRALPDAGGTQVATALFAGDSIDLGSLSLSGSLRGDRWRTGTARASAVSPRVGATWRPMERLTLIGAAYRAFRAPTLNELYRSFRLGNVVTLANDRLGAERLKGVEAGARLAPAPSLLISGRVFRMDLDGAVANVTVSSGPAVIVRQRQNLGALSSTGVELDLEARAGTRVTMRASYLFDAALVSRFSADPSLEGRRVPQQPRHSASAGVSVRSDAVGSLAIDARWMGAQFDDDQNRLLLAPCSSLGTSWARRVGPRLEVLAAAENLFRGRCEVGKTPITQLGPATAVRVGTRITWR